MKPVKLDRKPHDQRVLNTLAGPVGKILGLKTKAIWLFHVCCIEACNNPVKARGAALCPEHKAVIRKTQFGLGSQKYRDRVSKPKRLRVLARRGNRPSYRALLNPKWAEKMLGMEKNQTGQLATVEGREAFKADLLNTKKLVEQLRHTAKAVKRDAGKKRVKRRNERVAALAKAKRKAA